MRKKKAPRKRTRTVTRRAKPRPPAATSTAIQGWPTDPLGRVPPLQLAAPALPGTALATRIIAPSRAPAAQVYDVGTAGFRYWTAAEALRRAAAFWHGAGVARWHGDVGATLPVRLDDGIDLNAYYARNEFPQEDVKQGLSFFHDTVHDAGTGRSVTVFSGESPDVVAHELGHAVLDTLKPAIWGVAAIEPAAFHESFGDMSAILTALMLPAVRQAVIEETAGNLRRNSSVSRVAEQLGFAIRQRSPGAVDADSLRNAANAFAYVDPLTLPDNGPASALTRAPHNFSRVFTGAFLEALGGRVRATGRASAPRADDVKRAAADMGRLLVRAVTGAPVRTRFFQAVAEQLVLADSALHDGRYATALTAAFVRRGLLPVRSLATPRSAAARTMPEAAAAAARFAAVSAGGTDASGVAAAAADKPVKVAIDGLSLGLPVTTVYVDAPPVDDGGGSTTLMAGMAARDAAAAPARYSEVQAFVQGLVVRGRVTVDTPGTRRRALVNALPVRRVTHHLAGGRERVELERLIFECGD